MQWLGKTQRVTPSSSTSPHDEWPGHPRWHVCWANAEALVSERTGPTFTFTIYGDLYRCEYRYAGILSGTGYWWYALYHLLLERLIQLYQYEYRESSHSIALTNELLQKRTSALLSLRSLEHRYHLNDTSSRGLLVSKGSTNSVLSTQLSIRIMIEHMAMMIWPKI